MAAFVSRTPENVKNDTDLGNTDFLHCTFCVHMFLVPTASSALTTGRPNR